ncbi:MAG: M28 family peptidase [Puniceicoccaceae bacterium]
MTKWVARLILVLAAVVILPVLAAHLFLVLQVVGMPGKSFQGPAPEPDPGLLEAAGRLRLDVEALAYDRSIYDPSGLAEASRWVEEAFRRLGFNPSRQDYILDAEAIRRSIDAHSSVGVRYGRYEIENQKVTNFWVRIPGSADPDALLVVGAHYDTVAGSPGAYDNAAGIACLLEIGRNLLEAGPEVSVLLVAFTCEEHPASMAGFTGSDFFADLLLADLAGNGRSPPFGMISFDTLGNFSDEPGSQLHPFPLQFYFPDAGNFVAFVGDYPSRAFITQMIGRFREIATIPSEGLSIPTEIVGDVMRSDHSAFAERGIQGLMVTDTANFRVPNPYHTAEDTPEKIDYLVLARLTRGLSHAIRTARPPKAASLHGGDKGIGLGN